MNCPVMEFAISGDRRDHTADRIRHLITHFGTGRYTMRHEDQEVIVQVHTHSDAALILRDFGDVVQPRI